MKLKTKLRTHLLFAPLLLALVACDSTVASSSGSDTDPVDDNPAANGEFRAAIVSPQAGASFLASDTIKFEAEFFSGTLQVQPSSLSWVSSEKGFLGEISPMDTELGEGVHTITLSGTLGEESASDTLEITVSNFAVEIVRPDDGDAKEVGSNIRFQGEARYFDGSNTITLVSGAAGAASERQATFEWSSSIDGVIEANSDDFNYDLLSEGDHVISLKVSDDGANGAGEVGEISINLLITPPNTDPVVAILSPDACPVDVEEGTALPFTGEITDPDAMDAEIVGMWSDSLSGASAEGTSFELPADAALGKHVITFSATDTLGARDSVSCDVYVVPTGGTMSDLFPDTSAIDDALVGGNTDASFVSADSAGNALVGNDEGLTIIAADGTVTTLDGDDLGVGDPESQVNGVAEAGGAVLVATDKGLAICDMSVDPIACEQVQNGDFESVAVSSSLFAAAEDGGLLIGEVVDAQVSADEFFDKDNSNLPSDNVRDTLFADELLFVATDAGLCIVTDPAAHLANPGDADLCSEVLDDNNSIIPDKDIRSLAYADGILWIGTDNGLVAYNPATGSMVVYDESSGLIGNKINDIAIDENGVVWIATDKGVSRLDPATGAITNFTGQDLGAAADEVQSIFIDADGTKWFGTDMGVIQYLGA